jgi:Undecaprenyl-phosphate glucose phosphotransferase
MDGEREIRRSVARISPVNSKAVTLRDRCATFNLRSMRQNWRLGFTPGSSPAPVAPLLAPVGLLACQSAAIVGAAMIAERAERHGAGSGAFGPHLLIAIVAAAIFPTMVASTNSLGLHRSGGKVRVLLKSIALLCLAGLAAIGSYKVLAHWPDGSMSDSAFGSWVFAWLLTAAASLALLDAAANALLERLRRQGRLARRVVVFGNGEHGARFIGEAAKLGSEKIAVRAFFADQFDSARGAVAGVPCRGDIEQLIRFVRSEQVDEIVIALPWSGDERILAVLARLRHLPIPVRLAPESIALRAHGGMSLGRTDTMPIIRDRPISEWDQLVKDGFDRSVAAFLLLLALPTMAVVAALIKWDSPGPVFFRQKRLGFNNRPFEILKFRTMAQGFGGRDSLQQARRHDSRVTRIGSFLRRSSLDELPQLINVLRGEMSLIGPRPHPIWTSGGELWPDQGDRPLELILSEYASRHRVKPGITGWAQVCGCRGETETIDKMARRVEHDLHYIENWSLWLDIKILCLTLITVVSGENAH